MNGRFKGDKLKQNSFNKQIKSWVFFGISYLHNYFCLPLAFSFIMQEIWLHSIGSIKGIVSGQGF